jgi:hypothetical protein
VEVREGVHTHYTRVDGVRRRLLISLEESILSFDEIFFCLLINFSVSYVVRFTARHMCMTVKKPHLCLMTSFIFAVASIIHNGVPYLMQCSGSGSTHIRNCWTSQIRIRYNLLRIQSTVLLN